MKRWLIPALAILIPANVWFAREPILSAAGSFLMVEDPLEPADLIHVLGGGRGREAYAVQLYRRGLGKRLLFTGNRPDRSPAARYFHESANRAVKEGVPPEAILDFPSRANSTYGEAWELRQILKSHPEITRVLVVTNPYHSRRANLIFTRSVSGMVDLRMATVHPGETSALRRWWKDRSLRTQVSLEYGKLILFFLFESVS